MKIGKCNNDVKFIIYTQDDLPKFGQVLPLDENEAETLRASIYTEMSGNRVVGSYAFMWRWLPNQKTVVLVYKPVQGGEGEDNITVESEQEVL